jgi:uncharacterized membrane protein YfcA
VTPETVALLGGAGVLAGGVNAVAGGGSLISFPALLAAGYPPVTANVTNTVALVPGYAGSVAGSRADLVGQSGRVRSLGLVSVAGAVLGSVLLLTTPSDVFRAVVPFLILLGCALLLAQPRLAKRVQQGGDARHGVLLQAGVLLASVYGAYFGAGLGVVLLGLLGVFLAERLSRVNALKNVLSTVVNVVALVAFGLFGPVAWEAVLVLAVASLTGGYLGGRVAGRLPSTALRTAVVVYGVVVAVVLLLRG